MGPFQLRALDGGTYCPPLKIDIGLSNSAALLTLCTKNQLLPNYHKYKNHFLNRLITRFKLRSPSDLKMFINQFISMYLNRLDTFNKSSKVP
jgi:hypothetical protein